MGRGKGYKWVRYQADSRAEVECIERVRAMGREASKRYYSRFDNELYSVAVKDRSVKFANALIDAGMALCGAPGFSWRASRRWNGDAWRFLAALAREPEVGVVVEGARPRETGG